MRVEGLTLGAGWLTKSDAPDSLVGAVAIDRQKFPTRYEEYHKVLDVLLTLQQPSVVVDAGAGYNPEIHVLPYAMELLGAHVIATDLNPEALKMPAGPNIIRTYEDLTIGWSTRGIEADLWCCVSTLEHIPEQARLLALETALATLRPGGLAVLTADFIAPSRLNAMLRFAGFETGEVAVTSGQPLVPRVSFAVARKPGGV